MPLQLRIRPFNPASIQGTPEWMTLTLFFQLLGQLKKFFFGDVPFQ
jgi:hypothetical protein